MSQDYVPQLVLETGVKEALSYNSGVDITREAEMLSPEELKYVDIFTEKINIKDSTSIMKYGQAAQLKLGQFLDTELKKIKTSDMGEIGELITKVVVELKGFDFKGIKNRTNFFSFFKKAKGIYEELKANYSKVETNIDNICKVLTTHQQLLLKDVHMLDKMYELHKGYYKELNMYILAGKKKLPILQDELRKMIEEYEQHKKPESAQEIRDFSTAFNRFEKKIHTLDLSRTTALLTAPQIRIIQAGQMAVSENIQDTLIHAVPLWKSQMTMGITMQRTREANKAQSKITDFTNELIKSNAETLEQVSVEIAEATERGIIDVETLQIANERLISTFEKVAEINRNGKEKRSQAESELGRIEQELKNKMLETAQKM